MEYNIFDLIDRFTGKRVRVTQTGRNRNPLGEGICDEVAPTESGIEIALSSGDRWGLIPDVITETSVEGTISNTNQFRRKVELY